MLSRNLQTLIDRRGQEATLVKLTYGSYDPTTGTNSSSSTTNYTVNVYFGEYTLEELANDSILMGDRKAVFPPNDTSGNAIPEPDEEDYITGVGDRVIIKSVRKVYNADTLVCYICQVRE
jgi:hypothetical protein